MYVTDTDIERAIRNRAHALDKLPAVLMPFDPEAEEYCELHDGPVCD